MTPFIEKLPRVGLTSDGGALAAIAVDEPLRTDTVGYANAGTLTASQERVAHDTEVPVEFENRANPRVFDSNTRPLDSHLDVIVLGNPYNNKVADVPTEPPLDEKQRKGLRKMERIGGMIIGLFVDVPVRGSLETITHDPQYRAWGSTDGGVFTETTTTEKRHRRRGFQVGIGLPRILDRRRSFLGLTEKGLSNRGWAVALSAAAGIAIATPWIEAPVDNAELIERVAEDASGGRIDLGEIGARIPDIRIPFPDAGLPTFDRTYSDVDDRVSLETGDPTITHTVETIPGSEPAETVRLTQFGLGNFNGDVGVYDLAELDTALKNLVDVSKVTVSASASDESQINRASGSCGIGVPDAENLTLAEQRAQTVIDYLESHGIIAEDIQKLNISETVLGEQVNELRTLLSANNLSIQEACELYNNNQQDQLPAEVRSFFDRELSANRFVEVNFFTGEYRADETIENTSACSIESTITEYEDMQASGLDVSMDFDWDGNGLNLKGTSFGIPTALLLAWGVLAFGQVSRRQRTVSKLDVRYRQVIFDSDTQEYLPYEPVTTPTPSERPALNLNPGCKPDLRIAIPVVLLAAAGLLAAQCDGSSPTTSAKKAEAVEPTVACTETIMRVVVDANGKVISTKIDEVVERHVAQDGVKVVEQSKP